MITADHSEGTDHRVGTMRDGFEHQLDVATRRTLANQPVVNDDDSVIAGWCEHAAMYLHRMGTMCDTDLSID